MPSEILKSELDLFKRNFFQNSIENSQLIQYRPVAAITDSPNIEFFISQSSENFIDLENIFLWISGKLVKQDKTDYDQTQDNRYSLINFGLNTLWQQIDIELNNIQITQSSTTFPYSAYLDVLTKYDNKSKHTFLRSSGYLPYDTTHIDTVNSKLSTLTNESKQFKLYGKISNEFFETNRYLVNGVSMRINLIKAKETFCLMGSTARAATATVTALEATQPKLIINEATLLDK